jgi:hypothetical protein
LAKHLQTSHATWDDIDLISFRGEKPPQNFWQSTIVLDHQDPIYCGWSQFGRWGVHGCRQGDACLLFPQDCRSIGALGAVAPRAKTEWRISLHYGVLTRCAMLLDLHVGLIGPTEMSAPSGIANGIVILNEVPVSFLPSR